MGFFITPTAKARPVHKVTATARALDILNRKGKLLEDDMSQQDPIYVNLLVPRPG
ncbi:hypothetical protein DSCW_43420 [Desulfosarcina widdelii]|uniref:Uncharacterized protein n=1 Tax=Desulfosarcina widdelii TaxID=947919 RepID=A0A5K7Z8A9_9BACT|nr:hypothetical protein DSCW_43420 [Desulfosarcina widdelii]